MRETRSWYVPGKEPYNMEQVWSLCPREFLKEDEYDTIPEALMDAYREILN